MRFDKVKDQLLGSVSVSNAFVRDYLPSLDGDSVRLYLYLLYLSENGLECTKDAIAPILNTDSSVVEASFIKLQSAGLITADDKSVVIQDVALTVLNRNYAPRTAVRSEEETSGSAMDKRADRIKLTKAISDSFFSGQMPGAWYTEVELWLDKYDFTPEVLFMLFQQCANNNAVTRPYARKIADTWGSAGIKTEEQLEAYLGQYDSMKKIYDYVGKVLKLSPLTEFQKEFINKWVNEYGFGQDILEIAFRECAGSSNRPNFNLYDKVLTDWHNNNLAAASDVNAYVAAKKAGKTASKKPDSSASQKQNYSGRKYDGDFFDKLYKEEKK